MIARGEIRWADLGPPVGSRPAKRRPVLIVSAEAYNGTRLATVVAVVLTGSTARAAMPGNVFLPAPVTRQVDLGLRRVLGLTPVV